MCAGAMSAGEPLGKKCAMRRGAVAAGNGQIHRRDWTEDEEKPIERKEHPGMGGGEERHAAEEIRIPKWQMSLAQHLRRRDAQGEAESERVIRRENKSPAYGREKIDEWK